MIRVISGICDCVSVSMGLSVCVRALKEKQRELSATNLVHTIRKFRPYCTVIALHTLTLRSKVKGQGHRVMKCAAGVGMHIDITA